MKQGAKRVWRAMRGALAGKVGRSAPEENPADAPPPLPAPAEEGGAGHLDMAKKSLRELLDDPRVPEAVRARLAQDYREVERLFDKLERGHIHIAVFGRVSVGKSALLNALLGRPAFTTSPLHGETRTTSQEAWRLEGVEGLFVVDTPGINEVSGEERERLARDAVALADLVLFVVDGDLTDTEYTALKTLVADNRPLLLVLNKADRYTADEREQLLHSLAARSGRVVAREHVVACAAHPVERIYLEVDGQGHEREVKRRPAPDVACLKELLWAILEREGKSLAALNASLFAGQLSDRVAERITGVKSYLAERLIHTYAFGKGAAVAFNPVPVADVLSVAADAAMVVHLSRLYNLPMTRQEAGGLITTIISQMALLMGAVYGVHLASSALKGLSLGLSTIFTAGTQGAVAYYGTTVVGRAAERYFRQGKSWGPGGPKQTVREILDSLDRDSILAQAKADILTRLKRG